MRLSEHVCIVTRKVFTQKEAEQEITETHVGSLWIGLWKDEPIIFDKYDWTLIPRWMTKELTERGFSLLPEHIEPEGAEREILLQQMRNR